MQVIIMRGCPGAGKSSWIQKHHPKAIVVSADNYFIGDDEVYRYNPKEINLAHNECLSSFIGILEDDRTRINQPNILIVDNTNVFVWELAVYYRLAEVYEANPKIIRINCSFGIACKRNVHNVSASVIWSMYQTLQTERLPSWWKEEIVFED